MAAMDQTAGIMPNAAQAALQLISDAVIVSDNAGRVRWLNECAQRILGLAPGEGAGQPVRRFLPLPVATQDGQFRIGQITGMHGEIMQIEYAVTTAYHGDSLEHVWVFRNMGRQQAQLRANEAALFEERERAQVTLNSIGDAVVSTDFRGHITYLNRVAERITGMTQADAEGLAIDSVFRLVHASTRSAIACPTTRAIIEDQTVPIEAVCLLIRRDNSEVALEVSAAPIHDREAGVVGAVMTAHDVSIARELSGKLARMALHDALTDLPNRAFLADHLTHAMAKARRDGTSIALLYVDLDHFKDVNDTYGHGIGDQLLRAVALRLLSCVRASDVVSRQGGDEFVMVLCDLSRQEDFGAVASKVIDALGARYVIDGHELHVSASIGIASFPEHATDGDALLRLADHSLYRAKYGGRNRYHVYSPAPVESE